MKPDSKVPGGLKVVQEARVAEPAEGFTFGG